MSLKVLVAEEDLHAHKVIHDILEMCSKDVKISRALNRDSFVAKILKAKTGFDLILFDFHFEDPHGLTALLDVLRQRPELGQKVVLLNESAEEIAGNPQISHFPIILKPFSLDSFSNMVKRFRASDN
jgi:response regulator of citrate/malate metabolism